MTTATATTTMPAIAGRTRQLLWAGALAGPLWAVVALLQAAFRAGYDITKHPLSILSNGDLGWLQISNFVIAGALYIAGASGLASVLRGRPGGRWTPSLVRIVGFGMVVSGVFVLDPGNGFPVGTPTNVTPTLSWHGMAHLAAGTVSFAALIAACYVLGRHYSRTGRRGLAVASRIAGSALLVGDLWGMSGGRAGSLTLAIGAIAAMLWVCGVSAALAASTASHGRRRKVTPSR